MSEHYSDATIATYDDDRYGMMRVHIASRRADLACENYTRNALRNFAKAKGLTPSISRKRDLAWRMAQAGLICRNGYLRDGFPTRVHPPSNGGAA